MDPELRLLLKEEIKEEVKEELKEQLKEEIVNKLKKEITAKEILRRSEPEFQRQKGIDDSAEAEKDRKDNTSLRLKTEIQLVTKKLEDIKKDDETLKTAAGSALDDVRVKSTLFIAFIGVLIGIQATHRHKGQFWALESLIFVMAVGMKLLEGSSFVKLWNTRIKINKLIQLQNFQYDIGKNLLRDVVDIPEDEITGEVSALLVDLERVIGFYKVHVEPVSYWTWGFWASSAVFSIMVPIVLSVFMSYLGKEDANAPVEAPSSHTRRLLSLFP